MMDKTYILENGILELYVLGELTEKEQLHVETLVKKDTELRSKLDEIEETFENIATENVIVPPKKIKEQLLKDASNSKTKVIDLNTKSNFPYLRFAAGFAFVLMAITGYWMMSELNTVKNDLKLVQEENTKLESDLQNLNRDIAETNKWLNAINSPNAKQYILVGNDLAPNAKVVSYVNDIDKTVVVNVESLPELDAEHDYQMWADVDGEMINMGIINKKTDLLAMTYINNAESLNITIEPAGGNDHPTVSRLVTNVYLNKS